MEIQDRLFSGWGGGGHADHCRIEFAANTPVAFSTTGALPTGLSPGVVYYVTAPTTNSFKLAATPSGSAINTSGTQSGKQTGVSNPLQFYLHPCPRFTSRGNSGDVQLCQLEGASDEPLYSRCVRTFVGIPDTNLSEYAPGMYAWGNLVSLTVNVVKAYTGTGTMTLTLTANAFTAGLIQSNLSEVIDCTTVGKRTVTPSGTTGSAGSDSTAAFGNWISGNISAQFGGSYSGGFNLAQYPVIEVSFLTDQGITKDHILAGAAVNFAHASIWTDTNFIQDNSS
jgi:hypothetical protein